jgi:nicotinate-nucleotide adenylyltransferase
VKPAPQTNQKIGLFGGTFNPIHWGHLLVAETALDQFELDHILWVPTFRPSHKSVELLGFEHRLEMLKQAIAHHPAFSVSDIQQHQDSPFALTMLLHLKSLHPKSDWYWIIGLDAFQSLPHWYGSHTLADQCIWLVAPRQAQNATAGCLQVENYFMEQKIPFSWHLLTMPQVGISSSLVREYWQKGRSLRYLVPDTVRYYLKTHRATFT